MAGDALRGVIPEFVDAEAEHSFRRWNVPDTVRQARVVLWIAVFASALFVINDIRLLGVGQALAVQISLRCVLVGWAVMILARLRRSIDAHVLHRHLLAWALAVDIQTILSATSRPTNFTPMLMTNQTVLFALLVFWPLRFVPRTVNGACFAVALVGVLWATGTITSSLVVPLSICVSFALLAGVPLVHHVEWLRREEFARIRREKTQMEELREAKEAAEAADRAKTRFLAIVSHEVRTPMNGVLGVLQLMEGTRLDAIQRRQIAIARDCAEALTELLDSVIDYARLGAAFEAPTPSDFDPRQLVDGVAELMRPRALTRHTTIDVSIGDDVPEALHADVGRLRQVLVNLLSNAAKFTEGGRISVSVSTRASLAGALLLTVAVEDTGIGIPSNMLGRIFEEFTQADESIARRFGGTGLGLAVCRRVVSMLGGKIAVASEPGVGSRFEVAIPVVAARASPPLSVPSATAPRRLKLLVVDDDPINQIVACGLLAQAGHDATPVSSGEAAVAEAARERFDAVFMDLHMPLMDGFEAARRIRALTTTEPSQGLTPIVALTADLLLPQRPGFAELFSGVLAKPIRRAALRRVLVSISTASAAQPSRPDKTWLTDAAVDLMHMSEHVDALGVSTVGRLVHQFRLTGRHLLSDLTGAALRGDALRTKELAHRLASSASALGLVRFGRLAECVEQAAHREQSAEFAALATSLVIEFERAFDALREVAREAKAAKAARRAHQVPQSTVASSR